MEGTLYLCATPIGNLEDITLRVLRVLKEVDLIAAEDTRNSRKLLTHFDIHTPMTSYHAHNKYEKAEKLVERLRAGESIALITDAGMPAISDPGEELVRLAYEAGLTVTVLPGACACVSALALSGLATRRFAFEAFLPTDKRERQLILEELKTETRTMIIYEAPHRLAKTLAELRQTLGDRAVSVCRELTKRHETVWRSTLSVAAAHYAEQEARGECVLVIEAVEREALQREEQKKWEDCTIEAHYAQYLAQGLERKAAMKAVAVDRGLSRREVYQALLQTENKPATELPPAEFLK